MIFIEGHGGDGNYSYFWEGVQIAGPLASQSFTFEVNGAEGQPIAGTGQVISGDGQSVQQELIVQPVNCPTPTPPPPTPEILDFTCDDPVHEFITTQTVQFRWRWAGQLTGNEYLDVRVGPRGSVFLDSLGSVSNQQGPIWNWLVPASQFFQETAFDYEWEVAHMADEQTEIARSVRGCIHVEPPQ